MQKYIVSIVMAKTIEGKLDINAMGKVQRRQPDISIQNFVGVCSAEDPNTAYGKVLQTATIKHPDHKVVVRVVVEANAADLED